MSERLAASPGDGGRVRIGDWWVRPAEGLLERNGLEVRLRPRAMDVLALLATRPGHAVSKEEIFAEVWEGAAVEDGALAHCVSEIRNALGDTARNPCYIETLPKRGYRLVADVAYPQPADGGPLAAATGEPRSRRFRGLVAAALLAGLAVAGFAAWRLTAGTGEPAAADRRPRVAVLGITNLSGTPAASWLSTALSEMLTTELAVSEVVRPIPGDSVARIQRELSIADSDRLGAEALRQLRAALGVDYVVVGSYLLPAGDDSGEIRVDLRLQDPRSGEIVAAVVESGTVSELSDLVLLAGLRLRSALGDEEHLANQRGRAPGSLPASPTAARLYYQGLLHLRRLEAAAAVEQLERSAEEEPEAPQIHFALAEAWSLLGYDARATAAADRALELSGTLPRESQLWVETRCFALAARWDEAVDRLRALRLLDPANLDYGLELARAQLASSRLDDALATIAALKEQRGSELADPRVELVAAEAAAKTGDYARSVAEARGARELAAELAAPLVTGSALLLEAKGLHNLGRVEEAEAALDQARRLFAGAEDRKSEAEAALTLASWLSHRGEDERSEAAAEEALAMFREIGNRRGGAGALRLLGQLAWRRGAGAEGEPMMREALATFREIGDQPGEASALMGLGVAAASFGSPNYGPEHSVCTLFEQALAVYRELSDRDGAGAAVSNLGRCAMLSGEVVMAEAAFAEAAAVARELDTPDALATTLYNLGHVQSLMGEVAAADASFEEAARLLRSLDDPNLLGAALSGLGATRMMAGDLRAAEERLEESLRLRRQSGEPVRVAYSLCGLARLRLLQGDPEAAESLVREAVSLADQGPDYEGENARRELAFVLLESGRPDAARALLEKQPALFDPEAAIQVNLLSARITLGRVLGATGDAERGRAVLADVLAYTERKGMVRLGLQAELARLEIDHRSGLDEPGRRRLEALAERSRRRSLVLLARQAERLLAAGGVAAEAESASARAGLGPGSREAGK